MATVFQARRTLIKALLQGVGGCSMDSFVSDFRQEEPGPTILAFVNVDGSPTENQERLSTSSGNKMQSLRIDAKMNPPVIVAGTGHRQLLRGGAWGFEARSCRSASRNLAEPEILSGHIGFRVCCLPAG